MADGTDEVGQQEGGREVEGGGGDGEGGLDEDEGEGEESGAAVGLHQGFDLGVFVEDGGAARVVEVGHRCFGRMWAGVYMLAWFDSAKIKQSGFYSESISFSMLVEISVSCSAHPARLLPRRIPRTARL